MAIEICTFTLPSKPEALKQYPEKVKEWISVMLSEPNHKEMRMYRSSDGKEGMVITEIESVAEANKFLASDKFKKLLSEMEKAGLGNIQHRAWDISPLAPQVLRRAA